VGVILTCKQKLSAITDDLEHRVRPVFARVSNQNQEISSLKAEVCELVTTLGCFLTDSIDCTIEEQPPIYWLRETTSRAVSGGGPPSWGTVERDEGFHKACYAPKGARGEIPFRRDRTSPQAIICQGKRNNRFERAMQRASSRNRTAE
jgi:hypothetical protein